jgi:hypothetical protein
VSNRPITPIDVFAKHIPGWRRDVTTAIGMVLLDLIRGPMPPPWNDKDIEAIARSTATAAVISFENVRRELGDQIFGELVLFAGEEARRLALVAAGRPLGCANRDVPQ